MAARILLVDVPEVPGVYRLWYRGGEKSYVGSSSNLRRRIQQHLMALRRAGHHNCLLQRAWFKHGEDLFAYEVLETHTTAEDARRAEGRWIENLNTLAPNGFNLLEADEVGLLKHSEITRRAIAAALRGRVLPTTHKLRIAEAHKGKQSTPYTWSKEKLANRDAQRSRCPGCGEVRQHRLSNGKRRFNKTCGSSECIRRLKGEASRRRAKVTDEIQERMTELRRGGLAIGRIATELGLGVTTVKRYLGGASGC